jgi:heme exporter protein A
MSKRFGPRAVFRDLNFTISQGAVVAVVGRNGAGKSTLLRIVAGLERPSRGEVAWHDEGSQVWKNNDLRLLCGLAAPDAPHPRELSVLENLEFAARVRGLSTRNDELLAHLEAFGIKERAHDLSGELSSGLRARLGLALATLHRPSILLLDEPSANMDEAGREITRRVLQEQRARGIALVATNDEREAGWCDARLEL